jgi:hypothetical protein
MYEKELCVKLVIYKDRTGYHKNDPKVEMQCKYLRSHLRKKLREQNMSRKFVFVPPPSITNFHKCCFQ